MSIVGIHPVHNVPERPFSAFSYKRKNLNKCSEVEMRVAYYGIPTDVVRGATLVSQRVSEGKDDL